MVLTDVFKIAIAVTAALVVLFLVGLLQHQCLAPKWDQPISQATHPPKSGDILLFRETTLLPRWLNVATHAALVWDHHDHGVCVIESMPFTGETPRLRDVEARHTIERWGDMRLLPLSYFQETNEFSTVLRRLSRPIEQQRFQEAVAWLRNHKPYPREFTEMGPMMRMLTRPLLGWQLSSSLFAPWDISDSRGRICTQFVT